MAYISCTEEQEPFAYLPEHRFEPISPRLRFAVKNDVPISITLGGGPWFDNGGAGRAFKNWRRNCMWYGDDRVQSDLDVDVDGDLANREKGISPDRPGSVQGEIYLTLSRYNRNWQELRKRNRKIALTIIADFERRHSDLFAGLTVDGELEGNWLHGDLVTDYNPFAILEFRDWIRGRGLYGDDGELAGRAYAGSARYHDDSSGLANFNADFGTNFTTWSLKHYSAADFAAADRDWRYRFPVGHVANPGGFDPPRSLADEMAFPSPDSTAANFKQLWNLFRAALVQHEFALCAEEAFRAGIPRKKIYTHAIPGQLADTTVKSNYIDPSRLWRSAIPAWTAVNEWSSLGIDLYGDQTAWVPSYVGRWSDGNWAIPECHFDSAREYAVYWNAGMHLALPLVWPEQFVDQSGNLTVQGQAIRDFVRTHRMRPRPVVGK
jgi:hypothetical protein